MKNLLTNIGLNLLLMIVSGFASGIFILIGWSIFSFTYWEIQGISLAFYRYLSIIIYFLLTLYQLSCIDDND